MAQKDYSRYFFIVFVVILFGIVFLIAKPFIASILSAVVLAYIFYPLHAKLKKLIKNEDVSAVIVSVAVILILILPMFFIVNTMSKEAYVGYLLSKQSILSMGSVLESCQTDSFICPPANYVGEFLNQPKVRFQLEDAVEKVSSYIIDETSSLLLSIPKFILNFFIAIFTFFYLLKDGPRIFNDARRLLPLRDIYKRHLFEKFGKATFAIVYGYVVVGIIQGIFGAIGYFIFDVPNPLIWGIVTAFAALIPFIGTGIVWFPIAFLKILNGIIEGTNSEIIKGAILVIYGAIVISGIDNIIRPKIIGKKAKVHPVLILIGFLGGILLFGFVGVIIGPLMLTLFATFIEAYEKDQNGTTD